MKILIAGASGMVGSAALAQALAHPRVTRVVAFVRRDLPDAAVVSGHHHHPKLESVMMADFSCWPEDVLRRHADAAGMIWAMGTYRGHVGADLEYPLIFEESMERVVREQRQQQQQQQQSGRFAEPFRYVHLSGMFVCQDQEAQLWFLSGPRKLKGVLETRALAFGQAHAETWRTFIVRPGGIPSKSMLVPGLIASLSRRLFVRVEELGAFMVYLAMDGAGEEESLIEHLRIVEKGRELLLESQKRERT